MSVKGRTGRSPAGSRAMFAQSRDVFAGLSAAVISVAYGLSFAALIFAPPLNTWLAYGIAATFITSAISASLVAARSSIPFTIAAPDGAPPPSRRRSHHGGRAADEWGAETICLPR